MSKIWKSKSTFLHPMIEKYTVGNDHKLDKRLLPYDIEAYTIELGSEERFSLNEGHEDANRILHYLHYKGVISDLKRIVPGTQYYGYLKDYKTYYASQGGLVDYAAPPGEKILKNQKLYTIINLNHLESSAPLKSITKEMLAKDDCFVINHATSSAIHEGSEVYQVLENINEY